MTSVISEITGVYWCRLLDLDARLLEFTSVDYWRPGITGSEGKQNRN